MCILTLVPKNVPTPVEGLRLGGYSNPDGYGYAIAYQGKIHVNKSFSLHTLLTEFTELREKWGNPPAMFHSRIATHGRSKTNTDNLHPFEVRNCPGTYFAHNGILPHKYHADEKHNISDTRMFGMSLKGGIFNPDGLPSRSAAKALAQHIGKGNKLVFLAPNGKARIVNEKEGVWDKGCWWSNSSYCRTQAWYTLPTATTYSSPKYRGGNYIARTKGSGAGKELSVRERLNPYGAAAWDDDTYDEDYMTWAERKDREMFGFGVQGEVDASRIPHSMNCTCDPCWYDNYRKQDPAYAPENPGEFNDGLITNEEHYDFLSLSPLYSFGEPNPFHGSDSEKMMEFLFTLKEKEWDDIAEEIALKLKGINDLDVGEFADSPFTWLENKEAAAKPFGERFWVQGVKMKDESHINELEQRWADLYYFVCEFIEDYWTEASFHGDVTLASVDDDTVSDDPAVVNAYLTKQALLTMGA